MTDTTVSTVSKDIAWLKTHILLLAIVAGLIFGGVYGVESLIAKARDAEASRYSQIASDTAKQNQQFQLQVQAQIATLVAANQQLANQNQQLVVSLANRQVQEVSIPKQTASLTASQIAIELQGTANGDNVSLTLPVAQNVLASVRLVPLLQKDKTDLQSAYDNQVQIANNNQKLYEGERDALVSEQKSHKADNDASAAEIKKVKADCRKSKWKWLGIGIVIGFIGRGFVGGV
jgi:hypothetical protein